MQQSKTILLDFIRRNITEHNFENLQEGGWYDDEDELFESYNDFIEHNKICLDELENDKLNFLINLKEKIEGQNVKLVDMENASCQQSAKYFYYNKSKVLVLTSENTQPAPKKFDKEFLKQFSELYSNQKITMSMGAPFRDWSPDEWNISENGDIVISHPR